MKASKLGAYLLTVLTVVLVGCGNGTETNVIGRGTGASSKPFGRLPDGREVTVYSLTNQKGMMVTMMDLGATVLDLVVPDRKGQLDDISLGFDAPEPYLTKSPYFGAIVGRFANRIAKGQFSLDGQSHQLALNNGPNTLHGGNVGFDKVLWKGEILPGTEPAVRFSRLSPNGEEGYPGNLQVAVTYRLKEDNRLRIEYEASTDEKTVLNLSNHTYFNLAGQGNGTNAETQLTINADFYTPVDETLIPTGKIAAVEGTVMDFRRPMAIGARIKDVGGNPVGYDHNYVLNKTPGGGLQWAATVYEPTSGREMKIFTDQPGLQFYSGNFLDGTLTGKKGKVYPQYGAIVLETQHFPDSPNQPNFPSTVLSPGQSFQSATEYVFSAR